MFWIDVNLLSGNPEVVKIAKEQLMGRCECKECGELDEYVGCRITRPDKHSLKFTQPVLLQSFEDEFGLSKKHLQHQPELVMCWPNLARRKV